jgi:hypothetical protein
MYILDHSKVEDAANDMVKHEEEKDEQFYLDNKVESKLSANDELETREVLPYFSDPKIKVRFWTILKDAIGKDLTKISVPCYFNHPLSGL